MGPGSRTRARQRAVRGELEYKTNDELPKLLNIRQTVTHNLITDQSKPRAGSAAKWNYLHRWPYGPEAVSYTRTRGARVL